MQINLNNNINRNGVCYSLEILQKTYNDYIGKEIENLNNYKYIASKGGFIFITGIPVENKED